MLAVGPNSEPVFAAGAPPRLQYSQLDQLQTLSRSAAAASTYPDLFQVLADFSRDIGAGAVNCALFDNSRLQLVGVSTTMKSTSVDRYFRENMAWDDPLIPRIRSDPRPALLGWGLGVTPLWQWKNAARMFEAMRMDGYHSLVYFPVPVAGTPFSATITIRNELEPEAGQVFLNSSFGLLQNAAWIVGHRAAALFQGREKGVHWFNLSQPVLSPREREILVWLAAGLRTDQIAYQLNLKPVTIHMHMKSARQKLGAHTREQMMALAALRGLL